MNWHKEFGYRYQKNKDFLLMLLILLSLFALIVNRPILFILVGLIAAYVLLNIVYDRFIGQDLHLESEQKTLRLFPGDDEQLTVRISNHSVLPYINGTMHFQADTCISFDDLANREKDQTQTVKLPLTIMGNRHTIVKVPFAAKERGVTRLRHIQYEFPHLLNFEKIRLKYQPHFPLEIVVFPKLMPVAKIKQMFELKLGDQLTNFSPFEDILSPLGTRPYVFSDSFHRIHWKATAKTGELQTKVYERTEDQSYFFIMNITEDETKGQYTVTSRIEDLLSYAAYVMSEATKEKVAYEVALNARRFGDQHFIYQAKGQGVAHYMQTLENFARIHPYAVGISFIEMLYRLRQHILAANVIVLVGNIPKEAHHLLAEWQKWGKRIYYIRQEEEVATLQPWGRKAGVSDEKTVFNYE